MDDRQQAVGITHPLWTLLTAISGVGDEVERARLTATGIPALVPCSVSGVVLVDESETNWHLEVQENGRPVEPHLLKDVLAEVPTLFEEAVRQPTALVATDKRIPASLRKLGIGCLVVAPLMTLRSRMGLLFVGRQGDETFSDQDVLVLSTLREQSAITIENNRLYRSLRQQSESLQRQNELILRSAGEGIYGLDSEGRTTFVNPAATKMLGWTADELMGKLAHDRHHHTRADGSPYPRSECPIYASLKDGQVHRLDDEVFWRKDGSSLPVEYTSTPIREGGKLVGAVVVFRDITERKRAEEEVERLKNQLQAENIYLQEEIKTEHNFEEIVGNSPAIKNVLEAIQTVAGTGANVLITGETGTGKELVARAVHALSPRKDKPLIKVNCASIPRELFESEFFGHVRGAFTGAVKDRAGRFHLADQGTLFLDEVGEIPLEMQSKLLRVIQEGEYERIGEEQTRRVDVRVIAATNRDLKHEVEEGRFRQDLYYRLNVFPIEVAPLRRREGDIPLLAAHCLQRTSRKLNRAVPSLTQANVRQLEGYDWPGNVRELQNVIERAVITFHGGSLRFDLPVGSPVIRRQPKEAAAQAGATQGEVLPDAELRRRERENMLAALQKTAGRVYGPGGAAELLGIKATTLASRLKSLGIKKRD